MISRFLKANAPISGAVPINFAVPIGAKVPPVWFHVAGPVPVTVIVLPESMSVPRIWPNVPMEIGVAGVSVVDPLDA